MSKIPTHIWEAYWSDVKPGTEAALERVIEALRQEPVAFEWTPAMSAIWPADMRPTMSGLLAIWSAMQEAAVYAEGAASTSAQEPLADDGWIAHDGSSAPPARPKALVEVKFDNSDEPETDLAEHWRWQNWGYGSRNITHWRPVK